ncbi:MAG: TIGR00341 family protein [Balneolaceae bacterium]|nr:MAG: TIGR00341 family protein [Balneolaceae bacterium]
MALRLIKIIPPVDRSDFESFLKDEDYIDSWIDKMEDGKSIINILADVEMTEKILQDFDAAFSNRDDYRILLMPVAATVPSVPAEEEKKEDEHDLIHQDENKSKRVKRISREELYEDIKEVVDFSWVYLLLIALSCIVAANGLIRNSPAMVIGAMVIAPILGPNVGLALATTLGDRALMKRSLKSIMYGFSLGMILSILMGSIFEINPEVYEISSRTTVSFADIALGLAAGVAGCLSFTRGISAAVIGVMVAVALLPPMVATGLLIGNGMYDLAIGAGLLTVTYIICVNLAGVLTFLLQGIKPQSFRKIKEGEEFSRYAIIIWAALLLMLILIIYFQFT